MSERIVNISQIMQRLSERHEKLDITAAAYIGAEAASGLDHAHRKKGDDGIPLGIVHRDVSPQNVIISDEGTVKVSDFGLVKAADNVLKTQSGVSIGKMSHMAPEQAAGTEVDARADVFALGVTIMNRFRKIRRHMPPVMAAWIASKICEELDFAHRKHDRAGRHAITYGCDRVKRERKARRR